MTGINVRIVALEGAFFAIVCPMEGLTGFTGFSGLFFGKGLASKAPRHQEVIEY